MENFILLVDRESNTRKQKLKMILEIKKTQKSKNLEY